MKVTPRRLPYTATKVTVDNIVEVAQKYSRNLYSAGSFTGIDWDEESVIGPGDWIVTNAAGTLIGACDTQELVENYIVGEEK